MMIECGKIRMSFLIVIEKDTIGYHAYVPALKGIHVGGDTEEEASKNAEDAIALYMDSIIELGDPLPTGYGVVTEPVETTPVRTLHVQIPLIEWDSTRQFVAK